MREVLFRGKRIDGKEWVEGFFANIGEKSVIILKEEKYSYNMKISRMVKGQDLILIDPETACQYTGLTDKNGRKIFEGDIITYQHDNDDCPFPNKDTKRRVGRVYFQEFRSCFAVAEGRNGSDMINQDLFKYVQNGNRVEVIGNIFDNPELIGE